MSDDLVPADVARELRRRARGLVRKARLAGESAGYARARAEHEAGLNWARALFPGGVPADAVLKAHGPPPRAGLEWNGSTHRWYRPGDAKEFHGDGSAVGENPHPKARAAWRAARDYLAENGSASPGELAEVLYDAGVPRAKAAPLVDSLYDRGLLETDPADGDGERVRLHAHAGRAADAHAAAAGYLAEYGAASPAELVEHLKDAGFGRGAARRLLADLHHSGALVKEGGAFRLPDPPPVAKAVPGAVLKAGRSGLVLAEVKPGVHRWVNPDTGEEHERHPETGEKAGPAAASPAPPKKKRFGKSKAGVEYRSAKAADDIDEHLRELFGSDDAETCASVVGAPDDATVTVGVSWTSPSKDGVHVRCSTFTVRHADFTAERYAYREPPEKGGKLVIVNDEFWVNDDAQGKGMGAEVFARQVENALDAGADVIRCHAAKANPRDPDRPHNGYYTWPRFGYDMALDDPDGVAAEDEAVFAAARERFPGAKTVLDVMSTREGREWWKENGEDLLNARFDLTPGSRSLAILEAYLEEREARAGVRKSTSPPTRTPPSTPPGNDSGGGDPDPHLELLDVALAHADSGDPSAARHAAAAARELLADPGELARVLAGSGADETAVAKAVLGVVLKADRSRLVLTEVKPGVHRWVNPDSGERHEVHPDTGHHAADAAAGRPAPHGGLLSAADAAELGRRAKMEAGRAGPEPAHKPVPGPKPRKKRVPKDTVLAQVIAHGGIDPKSHDLLANYSDVSNAREDGIPLQVFRTGGRGLDQLAQELHNSGLIRVPENAHPGEYLLDQIRKRAHTLAADLSKEYDATLEEYYRELEEARQYASESEVAEAVRPFEEAGRAEASEDPVGGGGEGWDAADPGDASFDFGLNADPGATPAADPKAAHLDRHDSLRKHLAAVGDRRAKLDPDRLSEVLDHLESPHVTRAQIRELRTLVAGAAAGRARIYARDAGTGKSGTKDLMRAALDKHVRQRVAEMRLREQGLDDGEIAAALAAARGERPTPEAVPETPETAPEAPEASPEPTPGPLPPAADPPANSVDGTPGAGGKTEVEYVRAVAGGQVSEVDGKFYGGGQLMPVHGRYSGMPKPAPRGGSGVATTPPAGSEGEGGRGGRPQLTPEEQRERAGHQRKWDEMNAGPLGKLTWLGTSPNRKAFEKSGTKLKEWREFAESVGPEGVRRIVAALEPDLHGAIGSAFAAIREEHARKKDAGEWNPAYHRDVDADAEEWEKNHVKVRAGEAVGMMPGGKGHEKRVPGSHYARELVNEMMRADNNAGRSQIDTYHRLNAILASAASPPPA